MSGRAFLDTNIFVYAHDSGSPGKRAIARQLIADLTLNGAGVISYQVVHEFLNVALMKNRNKMAPEDARQYLNTVLLPLLAVPSSVAVIEQAIWLYQRHQLSWYDSLIVSAAMQAHCSVLYSEDLQHGQTFGSVTITDPFRQPTA